MRESLHFVYDGIHSSDMGVLQISSDSGLFRDQFLANKQINEEKIRGNERPYFYGVERDPLTFPLEIYFQDGFDEDKINRVARWLDQDFYKEFYTVDNPERVFFAMTIDSSEHIHNGIQEGYLVLNMRCISPYTYSPVYQDSFDFRNNTSEGSDIHFANKGNKHCKPHLTVEMFEDGDFSIANFSNGSDKCEIKNLKQGEIITIDNEAEDIESNLDETYRYDDFNDNYLSLPHGMNYLKVYGKCRILMKYRYVHGR